jgi:hypothetical protein
MAKKTLYPGLMGATVVDVRPMTEAEMQAEGWESGYGPNPTVIVFSNGFKVYPARDGEGNGPGCMFGVNTEGKNLYITEACK